MAWASIHAQGGRLAWRGARPAAVPHLGQGRRRELRGFGSPSLGVICAVIGDLTPGHDVV